MEITFNFGLEIYKVDLDKPMDLSISLKGDKDSASAWYLNPPTIEKENLPGFKSSVKDGGSTNFNHISFNPHAHVTHTECLGHITKDFYSVNRQIQDYHHAALLITVEPKHIGEDWVIDLAQLKGRLEKRSLLKYAKALIIRTLPNSPEKLTRKYDHTNPPYFCEEAMEYIVSHGIEHLLVDLPSVDKEKDGGELKAHNIFWGQKGNGPERPLASITEFIYAEDEIKDGFYLLNLQIAPIENDASPSRPVIYPLEKIDS